MRGKAWVKRHVRYGGGMGMVRDRFRRGFRRGRGTSAVFAARASGAGPELMPVRGPWDREEESRTRAGGEAFREG